MSPQVIIKDQIGKIAEVGLLEEHIRTNGYNRIVGVDEAGRGPLAGPVVAAAVILPEDFDCEGLDDSKRLTPARRELIFDRIVSSRAVYAVGIVDNEIIDRVNILRASIQAMAIAVNKLSKYPDFVIVDGRMTISGIKLPQMAVVGGDRVCHSVSAASVMAKVTRDRIMDHYAKLYPLYSFEQHKGYPTRQHILELQQYGPTPIHRKSYRPVQEALAQLDFQLA